MKLIRFLQTLLLSAALMLVGIAAISAQENRPAVWLSLPTQEVAAGQEFTVDVNVTDGVGVFGGSLLLSYNAQILEVIAQDNQVLVPGDFFKGQTGFTLVNAAKPQDNLIEYAMTLTQPSEPVSGSGKLGTVTFRALADGPVEIVPLEARLLSPQFTEVDGRKIARQVDEIEAAVQGVSLDVGGTAASASAPEVQQIQPQPAAPTLSRLSTGLRNTTMPVLIAGGLLFMIGLALFMTSVGTYVKLRRQFGLQEQMEQIVW